MGFHLRVSLIRPLSAWTKLLVRLPPTLSAPAPLRRPQCAGLDRHSANTVAQDQWAQSVNTRWPGIFKSHIFTLALTFCHINILSLIIYGDVSEFERFGSKPRTGHLSLFIHSNKLCLAFYSALLRLFRCAHSSTLPAPPSPQLLGFQSTQLLLWIHWTVFFTPMN